MVAAIDMISINFHWLQVVLSKHDGRLVFGKGAPGMPHEFTSLRYPLLRLQEAEYFLAQLSTKDGSEFQFHLNAFLSAGRSVTFVLQKSMKRVRGFPEWYEGQQSTMRSDAAMGFFLELRNISQKEGPVSVVGGSALHGWTHRFAGNSVPVPRELVGKDVVSACAEHLAKLGKLLLDCHARFPYDCCPATALSTEGMQVLGYDLDDIARCLGLPSGYLDVAAEIPMAEKLAYLAKEFEPLEIDDLKRLASGQFLRGDQPLVLPPSDEWDLVDDIAEMLEGKGNEHANPREVFIRAIAKRIGPGDE
ncbi:MULTISPECIES: hypothetical protein [unclassified Ruegeria]|uniref:hypothetical protein n=1 Tax=unclassified Ruegeria TaxID=2625375 RepID=UPI001488A36B|nr:MULTISPECIES: hypothetical protein [unclassified Ruegeria]NOD85921.1 hypothetical protein [Ruegeria sp. HKCCD6119]